MARGRTGGSKAVIPIPERYEWPESRKAVRVFMHRFLYPLCIGASAGASRQLRAHESLLAETTKAPRATAGFLYRYFVSSYRVTIDV
jgi:hypothetical protein